MKILLESFKTYHTLNYMKCIKRKKYARAVKKQAYSKIGINIHKSQLCAVLTLVITYCWLFNINILIHGNKQHSLGSRSACRWCCWCWESANIIQRHSTHLLTIHNIYFYTQTLTHPITYILSNSFSDHISNVRQATHTHTHKSRRTKCFHCDAHKSKTCFVILCSSNFVFNVINKYPGTKQIPAHLLGLERRCAQRTPCFAIINPNIKSVHSSIGQKQKATWLTK